MSDSRPICDYEGSTYRIDFWGGGSREYEDRVERIALRRLLPPGGSRILEVGAGFGRLTGELAAFDQVVLVDYSRSMLREARERLGDDRRYLYVAADVYKLPFAPGAFDAATMIRVIHHLADPVAALKEIRRTMVPGATFVLEFASKRHIKAILRYWLGRQDWNPFSREPVEFAPLNFDFHPDYIKEALVKVGFKPIRRLTVSHFRHPLLKRLIPLRLLVWADSLAQLTGDWWQLTPSVFIASRAVNGDRPPDVIPEDVLFRCPECGGQLEREAEGLACVGCGRRWIIRDGIHDFKESA